MATPLKHDRYLKPLQNLQQNQLLLHEIYHSIQGESSHSGKPCIFIRTTACHLRCRYCDTGHAFYQGSHYTPEQVIQEVLKYAPTRLVLITGGEPVLQPQVMDVGAQLCDLNYTVLLETSGSLSLKDIDLRIHKIMDIKTPGSLHHENNDWDNLNYLTDKDEIKFVLYDRQDYEWAVACIQQKQLHRLPSSILMSCVHGKLGPKDLVTWMLEDKLPVRLNLQLHKYIWGAHQRGV
jgi:7-carboxy-7-deazaguanine synthase